MMRLECVMLAKKHSKKTSFSQNNIHQTDPKRRRQIIEKKNENNTCDFSDTLCYNCANQ